VNVQAVLDRYRDWLPSKPHLGMVRHILESGWAYIEEDADGRPHLVNEHGGRILLSEVRWDPEIGGSQMRNARQDAKSGNRFGTVCDSMDAVESGLGDRETTLSLIDDAVDMTLRMRRREAEMVEFFSDVRGISEQAMSQHGVSAEDFNSAIAKLRTGEAGDATLRRLTTRVKEYAASLESRLERLRTAALAIEAKSRAVRGPRNWDDLDTRDTTNSDGDGAGA
jgi:hypothetical protein